MENPADSSSALGVEPATSSRTGDTEQSVLEEPKDADAKTEQSRDEGIEQKAHDLMDRITSARSAPNPRLLHALASLLEQEEARFMQESGHSSPSNARSSHDIGHLGNLLRENNEFFELVSSKFLSDTRYTIGVSAAAARLLLACPSTSMYPLDFEDDVLENIKRWAMEDMVKSSGEECHPKLEAAAVGQQASDAEMLKTYATGLLALALNGNGPVVEDVLTCGLSAKLMRFLRIRVLGGTSANQKDIILGHESRQATGSSSIRAREDIKGRMRHVADATRPDFSRLGEEALPEDQNVDKDIEKVITMKLEG